MNTTGMCLELYYTMKSLAVYAWDKPAIWIFVYDEERQRTDLAKNFGENRTSWDRMFAHLPDGFNQIVIRGRRSYTSYCGMSIDDVVMQPCRAFGEFSSARRYASAVLAVGKCLCLSLCLSVTSERAVEMAGRM